MKNILLIRLKSIGDVVFTLPAVNAIRDNFPTAKITYLTSSENVPLLAGFREVNEIIALDRGGFRGGNPLKVIPNFFNLLDRLRAGNFSLAVDFQGYGETAWLARLTGAPQRWGILYGQGRKWAYTLGVPRENRLHHVDRSLAILRAAGMRVGTPRNTFELPAAAQAAAREFFLARQLVPERPTLFIQPFTSSPDKNWPLENYLAVALHWQARGWQVIFGGGPGDRPVLEAALAGLFAISAGVPLLVTGALMQRASLVLGSDTGALHLAVALGRRVLMIMNSRGAGSSYPFQHMDWVVVPPSDGALQTVETAVVIDACAGACREIHH